MKNIASGCGYMILTETLIGLIEKGIYPCMSGNKAVM